MAWPNFVGRPKLGMELLQVRGANQKNTFLADMSVKGGGNPLSAKKMQDFVVGEKCMEYV